MNPVAFPINESFLHCRHEKIQTWKCPNCMKNLYQTQASTRQRSMAHQAAQVLVPTGLFLCLIGGSVHAVCGITDKIRQVVRITTDQLIKAGWTYPTLVSILSTVMLWLLLSQNLWVLWMGNAIKPCNMPAKFNERVFESKKLRTRTDA